MQTKIKGQTIANIEKQLGGKKIVFIKRFDQIDCSEDSGKTFGNCGQAENYCKKELGLSYGSMSRAEPIGLIKGDMLIPKWYNLYCEAKPLLDGVMVSDSFRNGIVEVWLTYDPTVKVEDKPKAKKSRAKSDSAFIFLGYGSKYKQTAAVFRFEVDPPTMKRSSVIHTDEQGRRYISFGPFHTAKTIYLPEGV